jgi:prophage regulatory protein
MENAKSETLLRLPEVRARCGLSRASIYKFIQSETFPRPVVLAPSRSVAWVASAVDDWIRERIAATKAQKP